jgi:hypothetical protein
MQRQVQGTQYARDGKVDAGSVIIDAAAGQTIGKAVGDFTGNKFMKSGEGKHLQEKVNEQVNASLGKSNTIPKNKADIQGAKDKLTTIQAARTSGATISSTGAASTAVDVLMNQEQKEEK